MSYRIFIYVDRFVKLSTFFRKKTNFFAAAAAIVRISASVQKNLNRNR
ncbi:hypothetical protein HMPREF0860_2060 [Treponema socranskii subsp. socranskii VPI DR56BR1116 = ATCC 35536]|uniref:Uncharacterized protein n=1 Tax=Treponema socranskii subsp. socranskii VPI DR56BR1116 = ATCC 35536 TaxID=1125725 RepID=U2MP29_TRESO|nr:hypothetical protein HMPREF1325_0475 [Treponema socranskii subsp. socranskii VPI DR56BR1116 = ATCC 35536]ERK03420.1 hypothetical protein HMPREF0860_2060 [Treponema socranskii subsp. socranskii VPI DR56BR1116 = ATCC 35536]